MNRKFAVAIVSLILLAYQAYSFGTPLTIWGYVTYDNGGAADNITVFITNERTGRSVSTTTDSHGAYLYQMANMPGGWQDGDVILIEAVDGNWYGNASVIVHNTG
ncbi:MAG: carboxypeptidase regulatory-like domain-containing protein, partial [Thermoplasmata archaeon]|nr:carboxypeptidase regulatory-like domain-containing protein [Thermoplasmata archaeon]